MTADSPGPAGSATGATLDASVVIPSYNNRETLLATLERFAGQSHPADRFEVVVVLDGSSDGSREALARLHAATPAMSLHVIEQANRGRAAAINRGAEEARGTLLIVTDADILVNRDFVASHVRAHAHADVVIGPIPLSPQSPTSFLTDGVEEWAEEHARRMRDDPRPVAPTEIYGANWSAPLRTFRELGGHREDLRRGEDWELGKKFVDAGLRITFCPEAIAEQVYDKTIPGWCHDFYVDGRSHARMAREFPDVRRSLIAASYRPVTLAKRLVRPLIIRRRALGNLGVALITAVLEAARRRGLRWRALRAFQGLLGDGLYFRGVYDEAGDAEAFATLVRPE